MMYNSSKGEIEISTMPLSYAKNALNKLRRSEPGRTAEIDALDTHVSTLEAAAIEKNLAAPIGHNNPPADEPEPAVPAATPSWDAVKIQMDDLLTEAANWADGVDIINQDQADKVGTLRQLLQDAASLAETARVAEKKPLDDQIKAIQDRYNAYIAPKTNKVPGTVTRATVALGNLLTVWLNKLADEKRAREDAARAEADRLAAAAIAARKELETSSDLAAVDEAANLLDAAEDAAKALRSVEREKVQVAGAFRNTGLRSYWKATPVDGEGGKALVHFAKRYPERVKAFLQQLADEDVSKGAREIPGFAVQEERRVA